MAYKFNSKCLGLASRYTSYVAVDPKANKVLEESWMMMKSRDVPVQVAHGWHRGFMGSGGTKSKFKKSRSGGPKTKKLKGGGGPSTDSIEMHSEMDADALNMSQEESIDDTEDKADAMSADLNMEVAAPSPKALTDDEKLKKLVDTQSFNGAFKVVSNLAELLNITLEDIKEGENNLSLLFLS